LTCPSPFPSELPGAATSDWGLVSSERNSTFFSPSGKASGNLPSRTSPWMPLSTCSRRKCLRPLVDRVYLEYYVFLLPFSPFNSSNFHTSRPPPLRRIHRGFLAVIVAQQRFLLPASRCVAVPFKGKCEVSFSRFSRPLYKPPNFCFLLLPDFSPSIPCAGIVLNFLRVEIAAGVFLSPLRPPFYRAHW